MKEYLPFLSACLSESMRLHAVVGMPLLRVVPEKGAELEGHFLPAGVSYLVIFEPMLPRSRSDESIDDGWNQSLGSQPRQKSLWRRCRRMAA
jgi:hypothetical protein